MMSNRIRGILLPMYLLVVTVMLVEIGVRMWGYSERHIYDPIYMAFDRSPDIPYVHKPNLVHARARGLAVINTDRFGLRTKSSGASDDAKQPGEYRIALVGDSCTFGEGVPRTEETFAQVMEDTINQQQQIVTARVFNFGASAYSVKEMAATLGARMLDIQPDLVVMAIIPQDFNLDRTPTINEAGFLIEQRLSHLSAPGSMARHVLRKIHLTYVARDLVLRWFFPSRDFGGIVAGGEVPSSYEYVRRFKAEAEQRGVPYLIVLLPRMQQGSWGRVPDQLTRDRITHIDLSSLGNEFTREQYMASQFDPHPSPAVHHRIGAVLAEYIERNLLSCAGKTPDS